ncbi:hypothetical protein DVH24_023749 [Malus domestica]|uniref:Uncharacterized protein n=1 Tax=Malus domestica TaxID=3750 RepID=A0A498I5W5_MALDO|nr:hypothetical protein DVH24_023749 [Malus domestica]
MGKVKDTIKRFLLQQKLLLEFSSLYLQLCKLFINKKLLGFNLNGLLSTIELLSKLFGYSLNALFPFLFSFFDLQPPFFFFSFSRFSFFPYIFLLECMDCVLFNFKCQKLLIFLGSILNGLLSTIEFLLEYSFDKRDFGGGGIWKNIALHGVEGLLVRESSSVKILQVRY